MTMFLLIGLLLPAPAGEIYLTREEAVKLALPGADRVVERAVTLNAEDLQKARARYGSSLRAEQTVLIGYRNGVISGYAQINREITRTLFVTFIVGVTPRGRISEVAVMSHDEHIGTDCRKSRFLHQFRGKGNEHKLRVVAGGGIIKYNGATMSCRAVARGVRRTVSIVQHHFVDRPENALAPAQAVPVTQQRYVMGALCTITAEGSRAAVDTAFAEMRRLDRVLSNYDPESELSRLNRDRSIRASEDLLDFVVKSRAFAERSGGAFDVTAAPLVALWGFKDGKHRVPSDAEIRKALEGVGSRRIEVRDGVVRLPEGVSLDPGAIGKGIAVDRAVAVLKKAGVTRALVDFGSTAYALGVWDLKVRNPRRKEEGLVTIRLENRALSTSGDYEKFFEIDGVRYSHLLDPRTGRPVRGVASASVVAPTATESDALSTATFVRNRLPEALPALIVSSDGGVKASEAWSPLIRKEGRE